MRITSLIIGGSAVIVLGCVGPRHHLGRSEGPEKDSKILDYEPMKGAIQ